MMAMHGSGHRSARRSRMPVSRPAPALAATAFVMFASVVFMSTAHAQEQPITAVYKAQELSFTYRGSGQYLPCPELQNRTAIILRAIGARDDIDVTVRNCDAFMVSDETSMDPVFDRHTNDPFGERRAASNRFGRIEADRQQQAHVRVRLMMPTEVTAQVLAEIEKDKSRRELVSRVTGNAAALNDPIVFAARREEVSLSQHSIRLRGEDCALLEQLTQQGIRRLPGVRVVRQSFNCNGRAATRIPPQLVVETLIPTGALLPMPDPERMSKPSPSIPAEPQSQSQSQTPPQQ